MDTYLARFFARTRLNEATGCHEWTGAITKGTGYGKVAYFGRRIDTHRVSWLITRGDIPEGMMICHHCDNRKCVNPRHLFIGTRSDNMRDAYEKGRLRLDAIPHPVVLSDDEVRAIDEILRTNPSRPQRLIADQFGVDRRTVSSIKNRSKKRYAALLGGVSQ